LGKSRQDRSILMTSFTLSSRFSLLTCITSTFIYPSANLLATSSLIRMPCPPASCPKSFWRVTVLGRLSVISSSAPPFFGSGLAGTACFFGGAPFYTIYRSSAGFGSSPSIYRSVQSLRKPESYMGKVSWSPCKLIQSYFSLK